jgi:tRNA-dihydrouridine synthase B
MKIGSFTIEPSTVLAPMAAITNPPFRQLCLELGAGLTVQEVLSADQLLLKHKPIPIERAPGEKILIVQLYGRSPKKLAEGARVAEAHGADVIDLNMGCPARKIVKQGAGVAMMREPDLAKLVTRAVVGAVKVPVTVKMRAGWSADEANAPVIARAVVEAGACAVTIHARLREAVHTGPFDWAYIRQVRDALPPEITVVGNGGIKDAADATRMRAETGCDGVMIGRAARGDPWIFRELATGVPRAPTARERIELMLRHLDLYIAWTDEDRATREMRKHLIWYTKGLPEAAKLRKALSGLDSRQAVHDLVAPLLAG